MKKTLKTMFCGSLMGIAETIPGISGATIALFLGIYEKLITSLSAWVPHNFIEMYKAKKARRNKLISNLNLPFLLPLIFGMALTVFLFAHIIGFLFDNYKALVLTFFIGFILSSTFISGRKYFNKKNHLAIILGLLFGLLLLLLKPADLLGESPIDIIITGAVTIVFGLLPGISGSFMMLVIGKYEFMLNVVRNIDLNALMYFFIGIIGAGLLFIKVIKHFFDNHNEKLFSFFFAFIIGSTTILLRDMLNLFIISELLITIAYFVIGILAGLYIHKLVVN